MTYAQLDLFDLLDDNPAPRPAASPVEVITGPGECPACGEPVPDVSGLHASLNHAFDYWGRPMDRAECTSMQLTRNHCIYHAQELAHVVADGVECTRPLWSPCSAHGSQDSRRTLTVAQVEKAWDTNLGHLRRDYTRAAYVWRNHLDRLHRQLAPPMDAASLTIDDLKEDSHA